MKYRYTYEQVNEDFRKNGYKLLSETYQNCNEKLSYICDFGHESTITYSKFLQGQRCFNCAVIRGVSKPRLTYEFVKEYVETKGYILLSKTYENNQKKLNMLCPQGHNIEIRFGNFKLGIGCSVCSKNKKLSIVDIKKKINEGGYTLITDKYKNAQQKLSMICPNGHSHIASWNTFQSGHRCMECCGKVPLTDERFKEELKNKFPDIECLDKYISMKTKLNFLHIECRHKWKADPDHVINQDQGCPNCSSSKGERAVRYYLKKIGVKFKEQISFEDCKYKNKLRFDFAIYDDTNLLFLLEYDGELHYKPWRNEKGKEIFEGTKIRDEIKTGYCLKNNIELLRIPYWQKENISSIIENALKKHSYINNEVSQ